MAERPELRLLESEEFDELMAMLDRYFSYEHSGMAARLPFVYDQTQPERHAVVVVDSEIVSHVACVPQTFIVGTETTIECHGIGGVATAKPHRGNGYMTALLTFWLDRMDDKDVPLAALGGDRTRYGHFGWEHVGQEVRYRITPRTAPESTPNGKVVVYDGDQFEALRSLHHKHELRVQRDRAVARSIYDQRGIETLLYYDERGTLRAYICLSRESQNRTVRELGGDADGLEALVAHCFRWYDLDSLTVYVHPTHLLNEQLGAMSSGWRTQLHRLLNIRDLPALVEAYAPRLERRWNRLPIALDGRLSLGIDGEKTGVRLSYDPGGLDVKTIDTAPEISLDRRAVTRLLFGTGRCEPVTAEYPVLNVLFPLEYYIWRTECV